MTPAEVQEIIDYLAKGNPLVWQASMPTLSSTFFRLNNQIYRRGDCTLFRSSRAHGGIKLYGWGAISLFRLNVINFPSVSSQNFAQVYNIGRDDYSVLHPLAFSRFVASADAYDEAFPMEFHNLLQTVGDVPSGQNPNNFSAAIFPHVPTTEEFFGECAPHAPLQNIACIASFRGDTVIGLHTVIACTTDGALYVAGHPNNETPVDFRPSYNELGLGTIPNIASPTGIPAVDRARAASPHSSTVLQRVYGDDASFVDVKFVKTEVSPTAGFALDDQGVIWMSGRVDLVADAADFPENSTDLMFFRPRHVTQYYDKTATLVSGGLTFNDFWVARRQILAITTDNRMFMLGSPARLGKSVTTTIWHEVGGFVNTVSITDEGVYFEGASGQAAFVSITFSAPDDPYGQRATGTAIITGSGINSRLKAIRIDNPGWGYTSPPTITINRGAGSPPFGFVEGTADCTIYTGGWKTAAVGYDVYSAIDENGIIYLWGREGYPPGPLRMQGVISASNLNGVPQPALYEKVVLNRGTDTTASTNRCFGVALDADGKVSFFSQGGDPADRGLSPTLDRTPELELTLLSSVDATLGSYSFVDASCTSRAVALVRDDHVVFTYGAVGFKWPDRLVTAPALGQGKDTYFADAEDAFYGLMRKMRPIVGAAKFTRVFGVINQHRNGDAGGFFAVREPEELDPMYGTRINPLPPYEAPAP